MEISEIYPTGTCIDDAMEYLERRIYQDIDTARDLIVVHAICLMPLHQPNAGKRFVHAWVEEGDICYFMGHTEAGRAVIGAEKASFYEELRPQGVTRYTMEDVYKENQRTRSYGPWKQEYIDLIMECQQTSPRS